MDIDKDSIRPPPAVRRKRPSAIKCVVVLCSLIGLAVFGLIVYALGKGISVVIDNARNPHQALYLNSTSNETAIHPLIGKDDTFDVYLTVWARVPDAEVDTTEEMETEAREKFGSSLDTLRKMVKNPEREILFNPTERVVYSEKMFERVTRKSRNLHRDISFELPLGRFYDELVFHQDVRAAVAVVPNSRIFNSVQQWTGWRPDGVKALGRLDDETAAKLELTSLQRDALDAISISFGMLEIHDRNYLNRTQGEDEEEHEYFSEDGLSNQDKSRQKLMKQWKTYQPHFVTKSHIYLVDESRPMNRSLWEKKHNESRLHNCGNSMFQHPTRFMCDWNYNRQGDFGHRLVLETENGEDVRYGAFLDTMHRMSGPKHLIPLPVRRGVPFDESIDASSVTVHHQFTFSSFTPGRKHIFDNFINPHSADKNATADQIIQAHSDWEQFHGILGNRGKDTHPRTRLIVGLLDDVVLGLPILILGILYWYTRTTSAGIDSPAALLGGSGIILETVSTTIKAARAKSISWELFAFAGLMSAFDLATGYMMIRLVLPFEIIWKGWVPNGLVRSQWTKRERATRRLEGKVNWTQRAVLGAGLYALVYTIYHYDVYLVKPLLKLPNDYNDVQLPLSLSALLGTLELLSSVLQLVFNHYSKSFAGTYALHAYMIMIRRLVQLTKFWPWFIGRYEVRGGIGAMTVIKIVLEAVTVWQALRYPRVEQVVAEDDE